MINLMDVWCDQICSKNSHLASWQALLHLSYVQEKSLYNEENS